MKRYWYLPFAFVFFLASCTKEDTPDAPDTPEYLLSATPAGYIQKEFLQLALSVYPDFARYVHLPKAHVDFFRVSYTTEYPAGEPITASGVFMIPNGYDASFPTVVYTHGTITPSETPSRCIADPSTYTIELLLGAELSSAFRCAVLIPDYVGYGDSDHLIHPYIHTGSLGQASIDFIRAFREYTATPGTNLAFNPQVLITGYSEGGNAAVALQQKIQETASGELTVRKTIAGSGAYDNVALATTFIRQQQALSPRFVSSYLWAIGMYKADYGYSKSYHQIFSDDDHTLLQANNYPLAYFATESLPLHTDPSLLFRQGFREGVLNGTDTEFLSLLKENSLVDFAPADSLIFVCGTADDWVYPENTRNAFHAMASKGCKVKMYEYPGGTHQSTMFYYLDILLGRLSTETTNN